MVRSSLVRIASIPGLCRPLLGVSLLALLFGAGCASAPATSDAAGAEATTTAAADAPAEAADRPAAGSGSAVTPEQLKETLASAQETLAERAGQRPVHAVGPENDETAVSGWLHDPELDRRYYLARLPIDSIYRRLDDGMVRTKYGGISVKVDSEDADWLYHRVYDYSDVQNPVRKRAMTEEDKLAAAARYEFEETRGDRLRFEPFAKGLPTRGQWRQGFVLADMDGDGHLDIVHGPPRKQHGEGPVVFLGDGAGNWRRWQATFPEMRYDYGDVAVADFDGDGRLDVALAMHLIGSVALVQSEPGVFTAWSEGIDYRVTQSGQLHGFTSRTVDAADWNGDGRVDLIVLGEGPKMSLGTRPEIGGEESFGAAVYLNQGDGSWRRIDDGTGRGKVFGDDLEVVDLDGDGRPDFVTGTSAMGRSDLIHRADGDLWRTEELETRPTGQVSAVTSGDFDGDGRLDIALGYLAFEGEVWRAGVDVHLRRDDGWIRQALWNSDAGRNSISALDAGDLDGDGRLDLVAIDQDGVFRAWLGDGDGSFTVEASDEVEALHGCAGFRVEIRDLDGDGRGDVVAAYAGEAGSEVIFGGNAPPRCPSQGALVVHRTALGGGA